ncbi:DNA-binding protein [Ktedonosporobacter rubrisoli]|uniref:DNA-binding protein n=1 Tax=Ktedonosporobacter rubrisoli TaxID=2509675 RepID=A0A4P6JVH1_KTERU|nr:helix-turn-helix domain-containing protein [Ktedonosporobacter rubrisoli]QBD78956.1 DNA-binding protein [Ktedonosporobacter rubrisoli]
MDEEEVVIPDYPGLVSVEQAAKQIGVPSKRVYTYIQKGHLRAVRVSNFILIPTAELENFTRNISGRPRKKSPGWRIPPADNLMHIMIIAVKLKPGQMERLKEKLAAIKQAGSYNFPGTIARYITSDDDRPGQIEIELVWRGAIMPDEQTREKELEAFRRELADVLDWSSAHYSSRTILMHA